MLPSIQKFIYCSDVPLIQKNSVKVLKELCLDFNRIDIRIKVSFLFFLS